jgi:hypothetical protein
MSYLKRILENTGYELKELLSEGVMNGKMIDHSKHGECECVDVSGDSSDSESLHYRCACNKPIRYAYQVTMRGQVFHFGSSCIKNWNIKCPDCESIKTFNECVTNSIDSWYRCSECHTVFIDERRKKKKENVQKWIDYNKQIKDHHLMLEKERDELVKKVEREQDEYERKQMMTSLFRQCEDCKKYNILREEPTYKSRCRTCYKK